MTTGRVSNSYGISSISPWLADERYAINVNLNGDALVETNKVIFTSYGRYSPHIVYDNNACLVVISGGVVNSFDNVHDGIEYYSYG